MKKDNDQNEKREKLGGSFEKKKKSFQLNDIVF